MQYQHHTLKSQPIGHAKCLFSSELPIIINILFDAGCQMPLRVDSTSEDAALRLCNAKLQVHRICALHSFCMCWLLYTGWKEQCPDSSLWSSSASRDAQRPCQQRTSTQPSHGLTAARDWHTTGRSNCESLRNGYGCVFHRRQRVVEHRHICKSVK